MTGNNKMRRLLTMGLFLTSVEVDAADWKGLKPSYLGPGVK